MFSRLCFSGVTVNTYSCLDPGIPVHGRRYGHDFSIGSTVSFSCDPGYRLSHEEPLLCEKNHWWSHPLPTCDGKSSFILQNTPAHKPKETDTVFVNMELKYLEFGQLLSNLLNRSERTLIVIFTPCLKVWFLKCIC